MRGRTLTPTLSPRRGSKSGPTFEDEGRSAKFSGEGKELRVLEGIGTAHPPVNTAPAAPGGEARGRAAEKGGVAQRSLDGEEAGSEVEDPRLRAGRVARRAARASARANWRTLDVSDQPGRMDVYGGRQRSGTRFASSNAMVGGWFGHVEVTGISGTRRSLEPSRSLVGSAKISHRERGAAS